jgi:hypothetical protein
MKQLRRKPSRRKFVSPVTNRPKWLTADHGFDHFGGAFVHRQPVIACPAMSQPIAADEGAVAQGRRKRSLLLRVDMDS